jgi:flagellar basal body-associated protein FliL
VSYYLLHSWYFGTDHSFPLSTNFFNPQTSEFELSYDLNGKDLVLIARAKAKLMVGTAADYASITGKDKLAKFDIGGLIDDSLTGTISLIPVGIEFPKTGLFEIARVKISTIKEKGVCLSKMKDIVSDAQKPQIVQIADIVNKVLGFFGGDICAKTPGLDLTDGFKIDVNGVLTLFDKTKINIYPIIDALKLVEPSLATVITAVQTVFGAAIKTAMNDAAKAVMPNQYDFTVNMGKLIADATDAVSGATLPTRRLAEAKPGADGKFNLGGIAKSSNPASKDSGKPNELSTINGKTIDVAPDANGAGCKKVGENGTSTTASIPGTMGGGLIFLIVLLVIIILGGIIAAVIFKKKQQSENTSPNFILAGIAVLWVSLLILTIIIGVVGTDDMNAKNGGAAGDANANATKCTTAATSAASPSASNSTTGTAASGGPVGMGAGFVFLIIVFTFALIGLIVAAVLFKKKSDEAAADGEGGGGASGEKKSKSVTNPVGSTANKKKSGASIEVTVHAVIDENEDENEDENDGLPMLHEILQELYLSSWMNKMVLYGIHNTKILLSNLVTEETLVEIGMRSVQRTRLIAKIRQMKGLKTLEAQTEAEPKNVTDEPAQKNWKRRFSVASNFEYYENTVTGRTQVSLVASCLLFFLFFFLFFSIGLPFC